MSKTNGFVSKLEKVFDNIIICQEYIPEGSQSSVMRYKGFSDVKAAVSFMNGFPRDEQAFHEVIPTDASYPLIFDYDRAIEDDDDANEIAKDTRENLVVCMQTLCERLDINPDTIHIESACRSTKISFHIKIFGTVMYLRHQEALISYIDEFCAADCYLETQYFDRAIYRKSGYQNFRLLGQTKLSEPCYLTTCHGNRHLVDTFINHHGERRFEYYTVMHRIDNDRVVIVGGQLSPFGSIVFDEEDAINFKQTITSKPDELETIEKIEEMKLTNTLKLSKSRLFTCNLDNIKLLIDNSFDLTTGSNWRSFSMAIKCTMIFDDDTNKEIYDLYDARCKMFGGYDAGKNKDIFNGLNPFIRSLYKLIWYVLKSGINLESQSDNLEDMLIDTKLIANKIKEYNKDDLIKKFNYNKLTLFDMIYGDNFKIGSNMFLFYNHITGIWDPVDINSLGPQLKLFTKEVARQLSLKKSSGAKMSIVDLRNNLVAYCSKFKHKVMIGDENPAVIPFNNGLCFDTDSNTIRKIEYSDFIIRSTNIDLTELTPFDEVDNILRDLIYDDNEDEAVNQKNYSSFKSMIGYLALGYNNIQKIFILSGMSSNGKSFISALLEMVLGNAITKCGRSLVCGKSKLGENPEPEKMKLLSRRVGIISELEVDDSWNESFVKTITGESTTSCRSLFQESMDVRIKCKLLITTNNIPDMSASSAMARRFVVYELRKKFCENRIYVQQKDLPNIRKADEFMINRFRSHDMKRQLYSYIVDCAKHFRDNGSNNITSNIDISDIGMDNDVFDLIKQNIYVAKGGFLTLKDLCRAAFGDTMGKKYEPNQYQRARKFIYDNYGITDTKRSVYGFVGIKVSDKFKTILGGEYVERL